MAGRSHTFAKRQREQKRDKKKREKLERRKDKPGDDSSADAPDGVDPDIAHIVPGPQPVPWEQDT